jgi:hypothetical protein
VVETTLVDGGTGYLLDLPRGSKAVTPAACVSSEYPTVRGLVRDMAGTQGLSVFIGYGGTPSWSVPRKIGNLAGSGSEWTLPKALNSLIILPGGQTRQARFTLQPNGSGDYEVYNFYIDPRMGH